MGSQPEISQSTGEALTRGSQYNSDTDRNKAIRDPTGEQYLLLNIPDVYLLRMDLSGDYS